MTWLSCATAICMRRILSSRADAPSPRTRDSAAASQHARIGSTMPPRPRRPLPRRIAVIRDDVALEAIAAGAWDALAGGQPLAVARVPRRAARDRLRRRRATGWRPRYLTAWRGDALVGALPLYAKTHSLRRIRVRLGLGGRLSPPRPPLLPEARRGDSVHAGAGPAPPRARRRDARARCSSARWRWIAAAQRGRRATRRCTCCFPTPRKPRRARRAGMIVRARRAVPLAQSGLSRLRRLPRRRSTTTSARR